MTEVAGKTTKPTRQPSKLDLLSTLLNGPHGATMKQMMEATGWQAHSVRGAMAGALRKRGLNITSGRVEGVRRWSVDAGAVQ